jgi:hypothetical protein
MKQLRHTTSAVRYLGFLLPVILVLTAGCGEDVPLAPPNASQSPAAGTAIAQAAPETTVVSQTIGPAGGVIVAGPARLDVPAGALDEAVLITVTGIDADTVHCKLEPHGLTFNVPVTLTLDRHSRLENTIFWYNEAYSVWQDVGGTVVGETVRTQLPHFSFYRVGQRT